MAKHTTFCIGGSADLFVEIYDVESLISCLKLFKINNIPHFLVGNGSNLLISDRGYRGIILNLKGDFNKINLNNSLIVCGSGAKLSDLCKFALKNSFTGLEFAYGIPGTCGGAVFMNAGAYGGEMANVVKSVQCVDKNGNLNTFSSENCKFNYRNSIFSDNKFIITFVEFELKFGNYEDIKSKMDNLMLKRKTRQPLEYPSAGSFFKRPDGHYAAALIEECGLKGLQIRNVAVSEKHAGFIVNLGGGTFEDVKKLKNKIQSEVKKSKNVNLEPEVIILD